MLTVEGLRYSYSGALAVRDVSLTVNEGEIVALIGSNGAGKSTAVNMIAGALKPARGEIAFFDEQISGRPTYEVIEKGITLIPEGRLVFPRLSVQDNLRLGGHPKRARASLKSNMDQVYNVFPRLAERRDQMAGSLSGGEQQMLAIGRGLMSSPRLMMLDEPSLGLSPLLVQQVFKMVQGLNKAGISILLVEQNAHLSLQLADRAYVLEKGRVALSGTGAELLDNDYVRKAFLGM